MYAQLFDVHEQIRGSSHSKVQPLPEQNVSASAQTVLLYPNSHGKKIYHVDK